MKCRKHLDERCHTAKACYVQMPSRPGQVAARSDTSVRSRCTPSFRHTAVNSGSQGGTQVHSRKSGRSTIDAVLICSSTATSFQKLQPGLSSCRCDALWPTDPANQNIFTKYIERQVIVSKDRSTRYLCCSGAKICQVTRNNYFSWNQ